MSIIKKLRRTLAASLMLAAGHFTPATAQSTTDVWFCNNTGSDVFIAMVYWHYQNNRWQLYAWQRQNPGSCDSIGSVGSGMIYYFAEKEGRKFHWPAEAYVDKRYCVPNYAVNRPMNGGNCPSVERLVGFVGQSVNGSSFTINLNNN